MTVKTLTAQRHTHLAEYIHIFTREGCLKMECDCLPRISRAVDLKER